jgi:hypothetical protein
MAGRLSDFRKRGCRFIRFHPMKNSTPELLQLLTPGLADAFLTERAGGRLARRLSRRRNQRIDRSGSRAASW